MAYHRNSISELIPFQNLPDPTAKYELNELIGTGTYGRVFKGRCINTGEPVAIKVVSHIPEHIVEIEAEYTAYWAIAGQKRHFPQFHGTFLRRGTTSGTDDDEVWFVMELLSGCTVASILDKLRENDSRFNERQIAFILRKVSQALKYLHKKNVIHRDIRAANLIFTTDGAIKVIDFGLSAIVSDSENTVCSSVGAPYWLAPEVIACEQQTTPYGVQCDIWSLGILAIELADTIPPLHGLHPVRAMFQIVRNPPPDVAKGSDWTETFRDFISECLIKNPDHRSLAEELLEHPFITQVAMAEETIAVELRELVNSMSVSNCPDRPHDVTIKDSYIKRMANTPFEKMYADDLASLESPTEESLLQHLERRYENGEIYSYVGDILLSVNPFKPLPSLYSNDIASLYFEKARSDNPPHVYAMADRAYQDMLHHKKRQVMLLYGPSGSGKTQSTIHLIDHLVSLGESCTPAMNDKVRLICPLLDALGNASTANHSNGSRFVKSIEVTFTKTGRITGAMISTFLFETTRVHHVPPEEKNFHIFYYVFQGLKADEHLADFELQDEYEYRCLPKLYEQISESVEGYRKFLEALKSLTFTEEEVRTVLRVLSAIILLGELKFGMSSDSCSIENPDVASAVSRLLGVDSKNFMDLLANQKSSKDAEQTRDSYMQSLYSSVVDWIVCLVNRQLSFTRLVLGGTYSVCVVDPPGFDNLKRNDIWQLCFNVLHDNLVNCFHRQLFTREFDEYSTEEVAIPFHQTESIEEHDDFLKRVLKGGHALLSCIEENSSSAYPTFDEKLIDCFDTLFENNNVATFGDASKETIIFQHVYDKVSYNLKLIMEQNALFAYRPRTSIKSVIESSQHSNIRTLFSQVSSHEKTGSSPFKVRSGGILQKTPAEIVELSIPQILHLETSESPHVIVCIKTNSWRKPDTFDSNLILMQLKYMKILEAALIRQHGYSTRLRYEEFLERYKYLAFDFDEVVNLDKANSRLLLVRLKMDGWVLGKTKIFLKYYTEEYLTRLYEVHIKMIVKIQALARRFIIRCRAKKNRAG